jgi:hypothetical protein
MYSYARFLSATALLQYAHKNPPATNVEFSGPLLRWAGNYASLFIIDSHPTCEEKDSKGAWYEVGTDNVKFPRKYFYRRELLSRASTILHESVHAKGFFGLDAKRHVSCGAGRTTCDPSWEYKGGYVFEAAWLCQFADSASMKRTTPAMRLRAKELSNITTEFHIKPFGSLGENECLAKVMSRRRFD